MKRIRRNISLVLALTMILQVIMPVVVLADNSVQDNSTKVLEEENEIVEVISETTQVEETVSEPEDPQIELEEVELEDSQEDPEPVDPEEPENSTPGEDDNSSFEGSEDLENNLEDSGDTDSDDLEDQDDEEGIGVINEDSLHEIAQELQENLITEFEMTIIDKTGVQTDVNNGDELELDISSLNSVLLNYKLERPEGVSINSEDTYTINLPEFFYGTANNIPISIGEDVVATYSINNGQVIIIFNENVEKYDNFEMYVNLTGSFNTEIFETEEEVVVEVPFRDDKSYTVTIKAKQEEYEGEDKKTAGFQYILNNGEKKRS